MVNNLEVHRVTSVIDNPRKSNETEDYFGIDNYSKGITEFVRYSRTPLTIAIQGEWGSGKTSLMNYVNNELCGFDKSFESIWLNTWEHSILVQDKNTVLVVIENILEKTIDTIEQSIRLESNQDNNEHQKEISKVKKSLERAKMFLQRNKLALAELAKLGLDKMGVEATPLIDMATLTLGNYAEGTTQEDNSEKDKDNEEDVRNDGNVSNIKDLRESLESAISSSLVINPSKKGYIFFIDDLDRLEPSTAVDILEVLKNLFNIKNCIFLLAIDYEVVVKGLQAKFGEMDEDNEREFRFFFDKIIQVPFTMPVTEYKINDFLMNSLDEISYFDKLKYEDSELERFKQKMSGIVELSIGKNPRSLKRLINSVSLLKIINSNLGKIVNESYEEIVFFALVSIQTAYPKIYELLKVEPCFAKWNKSVLTLFMRKNNKNLEVTDLTKHESDELSWHDVLEITCEHFYLDSKYSSIKNIFEIILEEIPLSERHLLGDVIKSTLPLTGLTDVSNDSPTLIISKANRINQAYWRRTVLREEKKCKICDIADKSLLNVSHIKPLSLSSEEEQVDINNSIVFCPNHHMVFDRGYISFDDDGQVIFSSLLDEIHKSSLNIGNAKKVELNEHQKKYIKWHRENIYQV